MSDLIRGYEQTIAALQMRVGELARALEDAQRTSNRDLESRRAAMRVMDECDRCCEIDV